MTVLRFYLPHVRGIVHGVLVARTYVTEKKTYGQIGFDCFQDGVLHNDHLYGTCCSFYGHALVIWKYGNLLPFWFWMRDSTISCKFYISTSSNYGCVKNEHSFQFGFPSFVDSDQLIILLSWFMASTRFGCSLYIKKKLFQTITYSSLLNDLYLPIYYVKMLSVKNVILFLCTI